MRSLRLILYALIIVSLGNERLPAQWLETNGPYAATVTALAVDGRFVFAGTYNGLYMTSDNGNNWIRPDSGMAASVSVSVFAVDSYMVFAGTSNDGVFRSTDDGSTWTQMNQGLTDLRIMSLATVGNNVLAGTDQGIFVSSNEGRNWTHVDSMGGSLNYVVSFATKGSQVYASAYGGIYVSADSGVNWVRVSNSPDPETWWPPFLCISGGNFIAGTARGIYLSTSGGTSWTHITSGVPDTISYVFAVGGGRLYATWYSHVYCSEDSGRTWSPINGGIPNLPYVFSFAAAGERLFAGTYSGVYTSIDNGASWKNASVGFPNVGCNTFAINGTSIFAGSSGGVYLSSDGGAVWTPVSPGIINPQVNALTFLGNTLYAGSYTTIYVSSDYGESWNPTSIGLSSPAEINCLATIAGHIVAGSSNGIYVSIDSGKTWVDATPTPKYLEVSAFALNGDVVFAATNYGLYSSNNYGLKWSLVQGSPPISTLCVTGTTIFAADDYDGVIVSTDEGRNWKPGNTGLPAAVPNAFAAVGGYVFLGTLGGIYISSDNGTTWTSVNSGTSSTGTVSSLALFDGYLFAGTWQGVLRRPVSEMISDFPFPSDFTLGQNYPNPFNPSTTIQYNLPNQARVTLKLYDVLGRLVATLIDEVQTAGIHYVHFNSKGLPSGVYFYRLQAGTFTKTKKLTVLK